MHRGAILFMRKILLLTLCLFSLCIVNAQVDSVIVLAGDPTIYINPQKTYSILDPGGSGNYGSNTSASITLISNDSSPINLCCKSLGLSNNDYVEIYDGTNILGTLLHRFESSSTQTQAAITCETGSCFIIFHSGPGSNNAGFEFYVNISSVYNIDAYDLSSRSVSLSWEDLNSDVTNWEITYTKDQTQNTVYSSTNTITLNDLECESTYSVYINSPIVGNSVCHYTFTTLCDITNYNCHQINDSCFVFQFNSSLTEGDWLITLSKPGAEDIEINLGNNTTSDTICGLNANIVHDMTITNSLYGDVCCGPVTFGSAPPCERHCYNILATSVSSDGAIIEWLDLMSNASSWHVVVDGPNYHLDTIVYETYLNIEGLANNTSYILSVEDNIPYETDNPCPSSCGFSTACAMDNIHFLGFQNIDETSVSFSWIDEFDVNYWNIYYKKSSEDTYTNHLIVYSNSITIDSLEGNTSYVFLITDSINNGVLCSYHPQNVTTICHDNIGCIDYTDIHSCRVTATYGTIAEPAQNIGVLDFGSQERDSRLTVIEDTSARDARTNYQLKMIPDGMDASVRLGNWAAGMEAEMVTYKFVVDTSISDLITLKYAAILENPEHTSSEQPKFTMKVFDSQMREINPRCFTKSFVADESQGYHVNLWHENIELEDGTIYDSVHYVLWKDWESVSLVLDEFHNQTIYIRLVSYDCAKAGHFGYAYFALSCGKKEIISNGCGDVSNNMLEAPEGFTYEWYNVTDRWTILSNDRIFYPPAPGHYECRATFIGTNDCWVILPAQVNNRYIQPNFHQEILGTEKCMIQVQLHNDSYISLDYDGNEFSNERIESYNWSISSNNLNLYFEQDSPYLLLPEGEYNIKLCASVDNGLCTQCIEKPLSLVYPVIDTTIYYNICENESFDFNGTILSIEGSYSDTLSTLEGCDSVVNLNLYVNPTYNDTIEAIIEYGTTYNKYNFYEKDAGTYYQYLSTNAGCDSIITLSLEVKDAFLVSVPSAITPDKDYVENAYFRIYTDYDIVETNEYKIFDRWGTLVFEGKSITDFWDGKYKGEFVPQGTYVYKIIYHSVYSPNDNKVLSGSFMVLY